MARLGSYGATMPAPAASTTSRVTMNAPAQKLASARSSRRILDDEDTRSMPRSSSASIPKACRAAGTGGPATSLAICGFLARLRHYQRETLPRVRRSVDRFLAVELARFHLRLAGHAGFGNWIVHVGGRRHHLSAGVRVVADGIARVALRSVERTLAGPLGVVSIDHVRSRCIRRASTVSDCLELLEWLTAIGAVIDRAAEGRPERILEGRVARAAIRALGDREDRQVIETDEPRRLRDPGRGESAQAKPFTTSGRDPVAGPWRIEADRDLHVVRDVQRCHTRRDLLLHDADGRAADEGRQQLNRRAFVVD